MASMRVRTHRWESFTVYNCDSRYGVLRYLRRADGGGPGGYNYHAYVRSAARHAHAYGVHRGTPSLFRGRPPSFQERASLPPIRGHAHDTRPRAPGGAFNARSLSSTRERATCRGLKRAEGFDAVFLPRLPPTGHPLFTSCPTLLYRVPSS